MVLVKKLRFFHLLFLCKIDRVKVFFDSLDRKQVVLVYENLD